MQIISALYFSREVGSAVYVEGLINLKLGRTGVRNLSPPNVCVQATVYRIVELSVEYTRDWCW